MSEFFFSFIDFEQAHIAEYYYFEQRSRWLFILFLQKERSSESLFLMRLSPIH